MSAVSSTESLRAVPAPAALPTDPRVQFRYALATLRDPVTARSDEEEEFDGSRGVHHGGGSRSELQLANRFDRVMNAYSLRREASADVRARGPPSALSRVPLRGQSARTGLDDEDDDHDGDDDAARSSRDAKASDPSELRYCCERYYGPCLGLRLAVRLCFSCMRAEPSRPKAGFYCDECFNRRHPWTRMPHNWVVLTQTPPAPRRHASQLPEKQLKATTKLLGEVRTSAVAVADAVHTTAEQRNSAAATCDDLMMRLVELMSTVRDDEKRRRIRAARVIQGMWRTHKARQVALAATKLLWNKAFDETTGKWYYVNRRTGRVQWNPPRTFLGTELKEVNLFPRVFAEDLPPDQAACMIQGLFRGRQARKRIRAMMDGIWRVVRDPVTGDKYYFNAVTGQTQWNRPRLLGPEADDDRRGLRGEDSAMVAAASAGVAPADLASKPRRRRLSQIMPAGEAAALVQAHRAAAPLTQKRPLLIERPTLSREVAAVRVQSLIRGFLTRRRLAQRLQRTIRKIWDPDNAHYYYFTPQTGNTSWLKPVFLRDLDPSAEAAPGHVRTGRRASDLTEVQAATRIQAFWRQVRCVMQYRQIAKSVWAVVPDAEYGIPYYFNRLTGMSQWERPYALGFVDADSVPAAPQGSVHGKHSAEPRSPTDALSIPSPASVAIADLSARAASAVAADAETQAVGAAPGGRPTARTARPEEAPSARAYANVGGLRSSRFLPAATDRSLRPGKTTARPGDDRPNAAAEQRESSALRPERTTAIPAGLQEASIVRIQSLVRRFLARVQTLRLANQVWEKHIDPTHGLPFYFDTRSGEASWEKPRIFRGSDVQPRSESSDEQAADGPLSLYHRPSGVRSARRADRITASTACVRVQATVRMFLARCRVLRLCTQLFEKVMDPTFNHPFYFNLKSEVSSWDKPAILRGGDLPLTAAHTSRALRVGATPRAAPGMTARSARADVVRIPATRSGASKRPTRVTSSSPRSQAAAVRIQSMGRAIIARHIAQRKAWQRYEKVWDESNNEWFWFDTVTGESSWEVPRIISILFRGGASFPDAPLEASAAGDVGGGRPSSRRVRTGRFAVDISPRRAALKMQAWVRMVKWRRRVRRYLARVTLKLWSDEWGIHYYYNTVTQKSSWLRPALLLESDVIETSRDDVDVSTLLSARSAVAALGAPPDAATLSARLSARLPLSARRPLSSGRARPSTEPSGSAAAAAAPMARGRSLQLDTLAEDDEGEEEEEAARRNRPVVPRTVAGTRPHRSELAHDGGVPSMFDALSSHRGEAPASARGGHSARDRLQIHRKHLVLGLQEARAAGAATVGMAGDEVELIAQWLREGGLRGAWMRLRDCHARIAEQHLLAAHRDELGDAPSARHRRSARDSSDRHEADVSTVTTGAMAVEQFVPPASSRPASSPATPPNTVLRPELTQPLTAVARDLRSRPRVQSPGASAMRAAQEMTQGLGLSAEASLTSISREEAVALQTTPIRSTARSEAMGSVNATGSPSPGTDRASSMLDGDSFTQGTQGPSPTVSSVVGTLTSARSVETQSSATQAAGIPSIAPRVSQRRPLDGLESASQDATLVDGPIPTRESDETASAVLEQARDFFGSLPSRYGAPAESAGDGSTTSAPQSGRRPLSARRLDAALARSTEEP